MSLVTKFLTGIAFCVCVSTPAVLAQDLLPTDSQSSAATDAEKEVYLPEFFDRFSPRTARDMLREIPGFSLRRDNGKRGLGQGGTNVIINGARVSGKQTDPVDILGRTPASNVTRIEIVDAASLGIPGLNGQVANFIIDNSKISGSWEWNPRFRTGVIPDIYNGKVSVSGQSDNLAYTFAFDNTDSFKGGGTGPEFVFNDAGDLVEIRQEDGQFYGENPTLSTNMTWSRENGHVGNLNAQYQLFQFEGAERSDRFPENPLLNDSVRDFVDSEDEWNAELSGDYSFDFLDGTLKLVGLQYFESSPFISTVVTRVQGIPDTGSRFQRSADEGESIARAEYSWQPQEGRSWEVAAEGVFNSLEIDDFVEILNPQGSFDILPDSLSSSRVEERRVESTLSYNRSLGEKVDLQASVGLEYSEISQKSDFSRFVTDPGTGASVLTPFTAEQDRKFTRPKGFVSAVYKKSDTMDIRVKIERQVGQLNFFDFIGSVDLSSGIDQSGNPDLVPPESLNAEIEVEKTFPNDSKMTLRLFSRQIENLVDTIPLELPGADLTDPNRARGEGPGNIESAERYGADFNSTFKLDEMGIKGGQLELRGFVQETKVQDPLTGEDRKISNETEWSWFVEFKHDVPETDYAYGFFADHFRDSPSFGLRQISEFQLTEPFIGVFVEDKDFFGMKLRVNVNNLANTADRFDRTFFDDFRDAPGAMATQELRERRFDQILRFSLSDTF